jgi:hypothetical protein
MKMMSENFSKCPKGLSQNLTIGLNLKFPAKTLLSLITSRSDVVVSGFRNCFDSHPCKENNLVITYILGMVGCCKLFHVTGVVRNFIHSSFGESLEVQCH